MYAQRMSIDASASTEIPPISELPPRRVQSIWTRCLTPKADIPPKLGLAASILVWAAVLAAWAGSTYGGVLPAIFMPTPGAVAVRAATMASDGSLFVHIWSSAEVVLLGFILSSAVAIPLGIAMGAFRLVQSSLESLVNFIRYLPVTAFMPLFILWIGIGIEQRVALIVFGTFFSQLVMIATVIRSVPQDLLNASYTLGSSKRQVLWNVMLPAALPGILDTLRVTIGWAWTYVVAAELIAASSGLGYMSMKAARGFQVDVIFLAIGAIGLLGLVTDLFFRLLSARFAAWAQ
jgi:NitT/TauT family transport system permease protein